MPATPKGAKVPQDRKKKNNDGFGKKALFPLELPSGAEITVTRPGVQALIKKGLLHSLDSLTGIVQTETIPNAEGRPKVDVKQLVQQSGKIEEMMNIIDKIALEVVIEPKLSPVPIPRDEDGNIIPDPTDEQIDAARDPELRYIDYVDENDKTFIMNFALGGSADLVAFRQATEETMGGLPAGQAAEGTTK